MFSAFGSAALVGVPGPAVIGGAGRLQRPSGPPKREARKQSPALPFALCCFRASLRIDVDLECYSEPI